MASERPIITRDLWQNPSGNLTTVPGVKSLQAAEVLAGFRGSWAGFHGLGPVVYGEAAVSDGSTPAQEQYKAYRLGQPGSPEINFAPFSHYTNRMGSRGGSLVGHPVSFEVVGPTLKSADLYWQWLITNNFGVAGAGDELILDDVVANMYDPTGALYTVAGITIPLLYGITGVQVSHPGFGGLYVVISQTGDPAAAAGNANTGLPDGYVRTTGPAPRFPIAPLTTTSKMEIFRVVQIEGNTLILDPGKRLADYFTIPADAACRSITILEPKAMRMLALPDSGTRGQETSFLLINPERASRSDLWPKLEDWTAATGASPLPEDPWKGDTGGDASDPRECISPPALPVPRPLREQVGQVITYTDLLVGNVWAGYGQWHVSTLTQPGVASGEDVGKIIHIHEVQVTGDGALRPASDVGGTGVISEVENSDLLGWYEIVGWADDQVGYVLRRVPEVDPHTGLIRYGSPDRFVLANGVTGHIYLFFTVHDAVSTLRGDYFDIDQVESARVKNIIDPDWVERTLKHPNESFPGDQARPDKAIFDTSASGSSTSGGDRANPGSLLDLGFRMVLYPATIKDDFLVPDFDRPVSSQDVQLNATDVGVKQYIDIDYSNGVVRLSHPVDSTSPLYPTDVGVFTHADNPRGELVLFASCVPYSMEPGQLGSGVRVTGLGQDALAGLSCGVAQPSSAQADIYGNRVAFALADQTITSRQNNNLGFNNIRLAGDQTAFLPQMGFMEILEGTDPDGEPAFTYTAAAPPRDVRTATFGYYGCAYNGGTLETELYNCHGGGVAAGTFTVGPGSPGVAVLRKDIYTPLIPNVWRPGTDYQSDVTFGAAKRNLTLRFEGASLQANADGSVTVTTSELLALSHQNIFDNVFSSWSLTGGDLTGAMWPSGGDLLLPYNAGTILVQGRYVSLPAWAAVVSPGVDGTYYVYIDGTDALTSCSPYKVETSLPLPNPEDILIAKAVISGAGTVVAVTDLRYPLQDVDRRTDIFVGFNSTWLPGSAHFATVWEAVAYANEIMNPDSGTDGRQLRIRVVGTTVEPDANLPIMINCDGLTIEGNGATDLLTGYAIRWSAQQKALFDLNGHHDLTFHGLHTLFTDDGTPYLTPQRMVFTNSSDSPAWNVIIEDCYSDGPVQGFLGILTGGLATSTVQRNTLQQSMDFGIYMSTNGAAAANSVQNLFGKNIFQMTVPGIMPVTAGIYLCEDGLPVGLSVANLTTGTDYPQGRLFTIEGNIIIAYQQGISVWVDLSTIENNYVRDTLETGGLCVGVGLTVEDNFFDGVYTDLAPPSRYGLVVGGLNARSVHNEVSLDGITGATDYDIWYTEIGAAVGDSSGNPSIHSQDNALTSSGRIRVSVGNTSLNNEHASYLLVDDSIPETRVTGGWYGEVLPPDGEKFYIEGATVGLLSISTGTRAVNCNIEVLAEGHGIAAEGCVVSDCEVSYLGLAATKGATLSANSSRFENTTFVNPGILSGNVNIFLGNEVSGDLDTDADGTDLSGNAFTVSGESNTVSDNQAIASDTETTALEVIAEGAIILGNHTNGRFRFTATDSTVTACRANRIFYTKPVQATDTYPANTVAVGCIASAGQVFNLAVPTLTVNDIHSI